MGNPIEVPHPGYLAWMSQEHWDGLLAEQAEEVWGWPPLEAAVVGPRIMFFHVLWKFEWALANLFWEDV